MTISTNADLSTLRPKNMRELYGGQTVYLLKKAAIAHLLWGVSDWVETEHRFGSHIATFDPHRRGGQGQWCDPGALDGQDDLPMTLAELLKVIGDAQVCMLGKECPKHPKMTQGSLIASGCTPVGRQ